MVFELKEEKVIEGFEAYFSFYNERPPEPLFKAEIVEIRTVENHSGADRLSLVTVGSYDWIVIASKNEDGSHRLSPGTKVIYIPIDSILPSELENYLFPPDAKIKLNKSRVRTIKIRGCYSQGMTVELTPDLYARYPKLRNVKGNDVTEILGIKKYEPPAPPTILGGKATSKKKINPHLIEYTDIKNFKYFPSVFEGQEVWVSEKTHGTSSRFGLMPTVARTLWQKLLKFFHLLPSHEYCFGSRRVQLQGKPKNYKGYYDEPVYEIVSNQYDIKNKLKPGEQVFGEILGKGIQQNYDYGFKDGKYGFFVYDVQVSGRWLTPAALKLWCKERGFEIVPTLYEGIFDKELLSKLRDGDSMIGGQKVREGIVIKTIENTTNPFIGRPVLKYISDAYLSKEQSDFH